MKAKNISKITLLFATLLALLLQTFSVAASTQGVSFENVLRQNRYKLVVDHLGKDTVESPSGVPYPDVKADKGLGDSAGTVINNYIAGGAGGVSHVTVEIQYPYRNLVESINDTMTTFAARAILGDQASSGDFSYFRGGGTGGGSEPGPVQISELSRYGIGGGVAPAPIPGIKESERTDGINQNRYTMQDIISEEDFDVANRKFLGADDPAKRAEFIKAIELFGSERAASFAPYGEGFNIQTEDGFNINRGAQADWIPAYIDALEKNGDTAKADYIKWSTGSSFNFPLSTAIYTWNNTEDGIAEHPEATPEEKWDYYIQRNRDYLVGDAAVLDQVEFMDMAKIQNSIGNATPLEVAYLYLSGDADTRKLASEKLGMNDEDMLAVVNSIFSPEVKNDVVYTEVKDNNDNTYLVQKPKTETTSSLTGEDAEIIHNNNAPKGDLAIITVFNDLFNRVANHFYNPQNYIEGARSSGWNITIKIALALIPLVIILSMVTYFRSGAGDLVAAKETIINLVVNIGLAISSYFITTQVINISIGIARAIMPGQSDFFTMTDADFQMGAISTVLTIVFIFIVVLAGLIMVFEFYMASAAAQIVFAVSTITAPIMIILSTYKPLEFLRSMWMKQLTSMLILLPANAIVLRVISELVKIDGGGGIGGTIFRFVVVLGCVAIMIGLNSQAAKQVFSGLTTAIDNTIGKAQKIAQLRGSGSGNLAAAAAGAAAGGGGGGGSGGGGGGANAGGTQTLGSGGVVTGAKSLTTQVSNPFGGSFNTAGAGAGLSMLAAGKIASALGGAGGSAADIQRMASTPKGRNQLANEIKQSMNGGKAAGPKPGGKGIPGAGGTSGGGAKPSTAQPGVGSGSKPQSAPLPVGSSSAPAGTGSNGGSQSAPLPSGGSAPAPSIQPISNEAGQNALDLLNGASEDHRVSRNYFDFKTNLSDMTSANFSLVASNMGEFGNIQRENPEAFQRLIDMTTAANNTANSVMSGAHVVQETGRDPTNYNESSIYQSLGQSYALLRSQNAIPEINMDRMPDSFVRGYEIQKGVSQPSSFYEASFSGALSGRNSKDMYRSSMNSLSNFLMRK